MRELFAAHSIGEQDTEMTIRSLFEETGMLIDPHTAVGLAAAQQEVTGTPMIVLSTAHPGKFPEAVKRATGRVAEQPERLRAKLGQNERLTVLPNDYGTVAKFISAHANAVGGKGTPSKSPDTPAQRSAREHRSVPPCQWPHGGEPCAGRRRDRLAWDLGRNGKPPRKPFRARCGAFP